MIGPGYFSTLGVPIRLGREILESDRRESPKVCVINEAFAKRFFDGRNPIGMRLTAVDGNQRTACQVVGVAGDARTSTLRGDIDPRYFVAAAQTPRSVESPTFLIRTATDAAPIASPTAWRAGVARRAHP